MPLALGVTTSAGFRGTTMLTYRQLPCASGIYSESNTEFLRLPSLNGMRPRRLLGCAYELTKAEM